VRLCRPRFDVGFALQLDTAALARGKAGISEGTDQAITDPAIRALHDRINVTNDPAVPHDGADVTVGLTNGASAVRSVRDCIGSRGRPMTNAELDRKLTAAAEGVCHNPRSMLISSPFAASRPWAMRAFRLAVCLQHDAAPKCPGCVRSTSCTSWCRALLHTSIARNSDRHVGADFTGAYPR